MVLTKRQMGLEEFTGYWVKEFYEHSTTVRDLSVRNGHMYRLRQSKKAAQIEEPLIVKVPLVIQALRILDRHRNSLEGCPLLRMLCLPLLRSLMCTAASRELQELTWHWESREKRGEKIPSWFFYLIFIVSRSKTWQFAVSSHPAKPCYLVLSRVCSLLCLIDLHPPKWKVLYLPDFRYSCHIL